VFIIIFTFYPVICVSLYSLTGCETFQLSYPIVAILPQADAPTLLEAKQFSIFTRSAFFIRLPLPEI